MSEVSGFESWFLDMKKAKQLIASCPDAMFFVNQDSRSTKQQWVDLATRRQVSSVAFV